MGKQNYIMHIRNQGAETPPVPVKTSHTPHNLLEHTPGDPDLLEYVHWVKTAGWMEFQGPGDKQPVGGRGIFSLSCQSQRHQSSVSVCELLYVEEGS